MRNISQRWFHYRDIRRLKSEREREGECFLLSLVGCIHISPFMWPVVSALTRALTNCYRYAVSAGYVRLWSANCTHSLLLPFSRIIDCCCCCCCCATTRRRKRKRWKKDCKLMRHSHLVDTANSDECLYLYLDIYYLPCVSTCLTTSSLNGFFSLLLSLSLHFYFLFRFLLPFLLSQLNEKDR